MMNLRGVGTLDDSDAASLHLSRVSDVRFANSIVGNLGAPLGFEEGRRNFTSGPEGEDESSQVANILDSPSMEYSPSTSGGTPGEDAVGSGR